MQILTLQPGDSGAINQAAALLVAGFRDNWPEAWPTLADALEEVHEALAPEKICRVAIDDDGSVAGWIGGASQYDGHVWELHPLVVAATKQGRGIGRALVSDLEAQVQLRGGITILLGTDDENAMTSLGGADLYPDVWAHIAAIQNLRGHPYTFYQKCGFVIVGVVPDANGFGKPDIMMAKRVGSSVASGR
jgi:aminoglycoside 6'-N-acetyltransferase I